MKPLFIVIAAIELGAGLALLCCPSLAVALLIGSGLDNSAAVTLGRVAGAAILAFPGLGFGLHGIALGPAVVLHTIISVWCSACLPRSPQTP